MFGNKLQYYQLISMTNATMVHLGTRGCIHTITT